MSSRSAPIGAAEGAHPSPPQRWYVERPAFAATVRRTVGAYVALIKPGIVWLLLVTTVPSMMLATGGWPATDMVVLTLLGGVLTAGGANAINQWFDRDIDGLMRRTAKRPLPSGLVTPTQALLWGGMLVAAGGAQLALTVNWLAAVLALAAVAFYVFIYTMWLKRWTTQNIVIGGAAGAMPPLVGWAAIRDGIDLTPVILFFIVFLWTPPHFWALALRYKDEYALVNVPMLPVVAGEKETKRQILLYALILVTVSLLLPIGGHASWIYAGVAALLGVGFVVQALRVWLDRTAPMALFFYSIAYLFALFAGVAADAMLL